jgi:hypothetical protein
MAQLKIWDYRFQSKLKVNGKRDAARWPIINYGGFSTWRGLQAGVRNIPCIASLELMAKNTGRSVARC